MAIKTLYIKKNDLQPYYYAQIIDAQNSALVITGLTVYFTMKELRTGIIKINRVTTGVYITDGPNGKLEYRWQAGDTDTTGEYSVEFEVAAAAGKFTVPANQNAMVYIVHSLDTV